MDKSRTPIKQMVEKIHVFNANLQKQLLVEYEQKSKIKSQEWSKLVSDKKSLITIIFGQCNDATRTKIALSTNYKTNRDNGNLIKFFSRLQTVCYKSDDSGLSYKPYKMVVAVNSIHNFSNSNPNDPHTFKEELKIKFSAVSDITGRFPGGTGMLEHLLQAQIPVRDWDYYCGLGANV